ncbi:MAG: NAD-binding protein, partial [Lachnospiraceae bacterium]|nr:NAD-binding protein [Lachnospiraceae bacterium]
MKKSVAVLGLGKYGKSLSENLYKNGADVLAVDCNEDLIDEFSDKCTSAVCANLANEEEVLALDLKEMDIVVVAMGGNLAASIMSVTVAKEQGVPVVVAKASTDRMASILLKVGADKIIDPEGEGGMRSAR